MQEHVSCPEENCDLIADNYSSLLIHVLSHKGYDYVCNQCKKPIKSSDEMRAHKTEIHDEKQAGFNIQYETEKIRYLTEDHLCQISALQNDNFKRGSYKCDLPSFSRVMQERPPPGKMNLDKRMSKASTSDETDNNKPIYTHGCVPNIRDIDLETVSKEKLQKVIRQCVSILSAYEFFRTNHYRN